MSASLAIKIKLVAPPDDFSSWSQTPPLRGSVVPASKEVNLGFPSHYTLPCLPTSAVKTRPKELESVRWSISAATGHPKCAAALVKNLLHMVGIITDGQASRTTILSLAKSSKHVERFPRKPSSCLTEVTNVMEGIFFQVEGVVALASIVSTTAQERHIRSLAAGVGKP